MTSYREEGNPMVWGASRVVPLWGAGTGAGFPRVMEARTRVTSAIEGDSMPDPSDYEVAFQIISTAGNAKSDSMIAIREARAGDFTAAQEALSGPIRHCTRPTAPRPSCLPRKPAATRLSSTSSSSMPRTTSWGRSCCAISPRNSSRSTRRCTTRKRTEHEATVSRGLPVGSLILRAPD